MTEWHLPPDYIVDHWTNELLELMITKMVERRRALTGRKPVTKPGDRRVSEDVLFMNASKFIEHKKVDKYGRN